MNSLGNPFAREWQIFSAHRIPTALNKIFKLSKNTFVLRKLVMVHVEQCTRKM